MTKKELKTIDFTQYRENECISNPSSLCDYCKMTKKEIINCYRELYQIQEKNNKNIPTFMRL